MPDFPRSGAHARTNDMLAVTNVSAASAGPWMESTPDDRTHYVAQVSITAGTGTVVIEGRISDRHSPVLIETFSASGAVLISRFPQYRARVTAAAGLSAIASVDTLLR